MEFLKLALLLAVLATLSACGSQFTDIPKGGPSRKVTASQLTGVLQTTTGSVDLAQDNGLVTVLQFASDGCFTCNQEANAFRSSLKNPSQNPSKVRLITVLVQSPMDDAKLWKQDHQIPWTVAIDPNAAFFRSYCTEDIVPCLVIHKPDQGIVLREKGMVKMNQVLDLTGPWED